MLDDIFTGLNPAWNCLNFENFKATQISVVISSNSEDQTESLNHVFVIPHYHVPKLCRLNGQPPPTKIKHPKRWPIWYRFSENNSPETINLRILSTIDYQQYKALVGDMSCYFPGEYQPETNWATFKTLGRHSMKYWVVHDRILIMAPEIIPHITWVVNI